MRPNQKCDCGKCRRCKHRIYMATYSQRPEARERQRQRARQWYERNREAVKSRIAEYQARPEVKAAAPAKARRWEQRNREKYLAQKRARYALERGYIERQGCEVCGARAEMHHDDYSKPDEVRWLCRQHHKDQHASS